MESSPCHQIFPFGPNKRYLSKKIVDIPVKVQRDDGKDDALKVQAYLVDADIPFLYGKRTMELWQSKIDTKKKILETEINRRWKDFKMVVTTGKHYGIILETKGRKSVDVLFLEDQEEELTSFKETMLAIRKVHEINNHKKRE